MSDYCASAFVVASLSWVSCRRSSVSFVN